MPQKSEHWAGLKLNTCPVSSVHTLAFDYSTFKQFNLFQDKGKNKECLGVEECECVTMQWN